LEKKKNYKGELKLLKLKTAELIDLDTAEDN